MWRPESVKKILQNEKYIGDALLQKNVTVDFLTKKRVENEEHIPQTNEFSEVIDDEF